MGGVAPKPAAPTPAATGPAPGGKAASMGGGAPQAAAQVGGSATPQKKPEGLFGGIVQGLQDMGKAVTDTVKGAVDGGKAIVDGAAKANQDLSKQLAPAGKAIEDAVQNTGTFIDEHKTEIGLVATGVALAASGPVGWAAAGVALGLGALEASEQAKKGDAGGAALSIAGAIPGLGLGFKGAKLGAEALKAGEELAKGVNVADKAAEGAVKGGQAAADGGSAAGKAGVDAGKVATPAAKPEVIQKETINPNPVKPKDATDKWDEFLGPPPHSNVNPRTGETDPNRIFSTDGTSSIRFGQHEMGSSPTKFHFHQETWGKDPVSGTWTVDNELIRVPFPKGAW